MDLFEVVDRVREQLQRRGRITYRMLQAQFKLDGGDMEALKKLFLRESLNQPLILIFEDLHWIDSEMQGFLDVLSESVASARLLLLTNYRPEYRHEWGQKTYYTQLRLGPLGQAEAEEFLDALLGATVGADPRVGPQKGAHRGAPLHALKRLILEKTQGTPFFMEEIVQELVE